MKNNIKTPANSMSESHRKSDVLSEGQLLRGRKKTTKEVRMELEKEKDRAGKIEKKEIDRNGAGVRGRA